MCSGGRNVLSSQAGLLWPWSGNGLNTSSLLLHQFELAPLVPKEEGEEGIEKQDEEEVDLASSQSMNAAAVVVVAGVGVLSECEACSSNGSVVPFSSHLPL